MGRSIPSVVFVCPRLLGIVIAAVLLLAFVERPSSLSVSSDPRYRSVAWEPPCGFTESIEMICLIVFTLDLAIKVNRCNVKILWARGVGQNLLVQETIAASFSVCFQSYLIGWEEFRKSKWLISYTVVICVSVIDWVLSVSMLCDEVKLILVTVRQYTSDFSFPTNPLCPAVLPDCSLTLGLSEPHLYCV